MKAILVHSPVILDVFLNDLVWGDWSESKLDEYRYQSYFPTVKLISP